MNTSSDNNVDGDVDNPNVDFSGTTVASDRLDAEAADNNIPADVQTDFTPSDPNAGQPSEGKIADRSR